MTEIPMITMIVYIILAAYREVVTGNKILIRAIPLIAATLGMGISVAVYLIAPEVVSADMLLQAIYRGLISGLAATGVSQILKQLGKDGEDVIKPN